MLKKIKYYFKKLWHQYIVCDAFVIVFVDKCNIGDIYETTRGDKMEILWETKGERFYKYWVINIK